MKKTYKIADIIIAIDDPFEIDNFANANIFLTESTSPDFLFDYKNKNDISNLFNNSKIIYQTEYYFILVQNKIFYKAFHHEGNIYAINFMDPTTTNGTCYYSDFSLMKYKLQKGYTSFMYIELERILLQYNSFILHSSYIRWEGKGILFSAPSGMGKSTQATLWETYERAEVINGDRTAIRNNDGHWVAHGLPICGTSNICKNASSPLCAIIVIRQCPTNSIKKLSPFEAFKALYSETTINRWNNLFVQKIMELIQQLSTEVPIIQLNCTKDQTAVNTLKYYLLEKEII